MNTTPHDILHGLFAWGSMDIDDLCRQFDAFEVDPSEGGDWLQENEHYVNDFENLTAADGVNLVHHCIFNIALDKACYNWDHDAIEIYLNCLDTHLSVAGEEIYDAEGLREAVAKLNTEHA